MAAAAISVIPTLEQRPIKNTICLFDVDGTLTPARRVRPPSLHSIALRDPSEPRVASTLHSREQGLRPIPSSTQRIQSHLHTLLPPTNHATPDCLPRSPPSPLRAPPQSSHRLRGRLGPNKTTRTTRHLQHPRNITLRLLLCRKRTHGLPDGRAPRLAQFHKMDW